MAHKTASEEPVEVLFALHPKFDLLDFAGPLEVLTSSQHDVNDACKSFVSLFVLCSGRGRWRIYRKGY